MVRSIQTSKGGRMTSFRRISAASLAMLQAAAKLAERGPFLYASATSFRPINRAICFALSFCS